MPLSILGVVSNNNLILHASRSLFLTLALSFLKIPILFLQGLHTYIHPDDVNPPNQSNSQSGIRASIRRPGSTDQAAEFKPKKRYNDKFEFDENKAQILRLKLNDAHLRSRLYYDQFAGVFNFTIVASSCLLVSKLLAYSKGNGVLKNGTLIPILLGFAGVCRVVMLIARVSFERSASKRSEKQLSFLIGVIGFAIGVLIVYDIVPNWLLDFGFGSLDGMREYNLRMAVIHGVYCVQTSMESTAFLFKQRE